MWLKYDVDWGGTLDKNEIWEMVKEMVKESSAQADFSYEEFELLF